MNVLGITICENVAFSLINKFLNNINSTCHICACIVRADDNYVTGETVDLNTQGNYDCLNGLVMEDITRMNTTIEATAPEISIWEHGENNSRMVESLPVLKNGPKLLQTQAFWKPSGGFN